MKTISQVISYLFHPLLFPAYGTLIIVGLNPGLFGPFGQKIQMVWLIIVFALTFMFPAIWILMMRGLQMIDSLNLATQKERIIPFVATATFYLWAAWMFKPNPNMNPHDHMPHLAVNPFIFYMMIGACFSIFVAFFLNIFTKISLHTIGAGGLLGLVLVMVRSSPYDLRLMLVAIILLAGIIGTARLWLKSHTQAEVFSGYLIGFTGQFIGFTIAARLV